MSIPQPRTVITRLRDAGCVFAEDEAHLLGSAARTPAELAALVDQRVAGLPLEHILGWAEFCGQRITVHPPVFIPRRRTELLARAAIARTSPGAVVVELCCGSGAVAATIAAAEDQVELHAVDIDPAAVRCARTNLAATSARIYEGDLYSPLPAALHGQVDLLVTNAPYVPTGAVELLPPEARTHEPRVALDGGTDGTDILRRTVSQAPRWLAPDGHLLMETGEHQVPQIIDIATEHGLDAQAIRAEDLDATIVIATNPAPRCRT